MMRLTNVNDGYPKDGKQVLVFTEFWTSIGERWDGQWLDEFELPFSGRSERWTDCTITHWQELPTLEENK